jgi:hypothetical protein
MSTIPTKRVIYRPDGREMTINAEDFDPKIHAEPGEKVLVPASTASASETVTGSPDDFVIADEEPTPEPAPPAEPAEPVEDIPATAGKGKGKGKK